MLGPLALPMAGSQTLVVGKVKDDQIPVIVNAVHINEIDVVGLACACFRGAPDKTCGGMLFEVDGTTLATDCTPGYIAGTCSGTTPKSCATASDCSGGLGCVGGICADCRVDDDCGGGQCVMHACDGKSPCAFVHGLGGTCSVTTSKTCRQDSNCPSGETCVRAGNSSSGVISCVPGLKGTNMLVTEDSKRADGQEDPPQCDYTNSNTYVQGSTFPDCAQAPVITLSDQTPAAPAGAALVFNSTAIGQFIGPCLYNPNRPENFCTDQEGYSTRGLPNTLPSVTGSASAEMYNIFLAGMTTDLAVCDCADERSFSCPVVTPCEAGSTCCSGPLSIPGSPLPSCKQLLASPPNVSGLGLAGAFTSPAQATIGDIVVTDLLQAK